MTTVDWEQPLATLLRESTKQAHQHAETSEGASLILGGQMPREGYVKYLMMLWHVYDSFERALDRHATHPALEPTYNPTLLARAPALASDISFFLQVPETSWQSHPVYKQFVADMPEQLTTYVNRIRTLSDSADPSPLLAHAYVRYLGDLSGGQTIRRTIGKAYDLDESSHEGLEFYAFKELTSSKPANQGEMKRIKEWFREGMNTAGKLGTETKAKVVEEANLAFHLNTGLFTALSETTKVEKKTPSGFAEVSVEQPAEAEKTYPVSQVVAVIAAVGLAHFLLVTGGFTGNRGYEKLLAIEGWLRSVFGSASTPA